MAKHSHTSTRRTFLGVMTVAPLLAIPAMAATPSDFPARLTEYHRAHAEFERMCAVDFDNADAAGTACRDALRAMIETPSPDLAAVATKLEVLQVQYADGEFPDELMPFVTRDVKRLSRH